MPRYEKGTLSYFENHGYGDLTAPKRKTPDPDDAKRVFLETAIEGPWTPPKDPDWFGIGIDGDVYRYSVSNGKVHFSGKTGPSNTMRIRKEDIPMEARKALKWTAPAGR